MAGKRKPDYDPMAVGAMHAENIAAIAEYEGQPAKGHNNPPDDFAERKATALKAIDDLYDEAVNWCDGEPIASEEMHDGVTKLYDGLTAAAKLADCLRVEEKKPLDDKVAAIQAEFNPYIQKDRGKVDKAKKSLSELLTVWRKKVADEKAAIAAKIAAEAAEARRLAEIAVRSSTGNLMARDEAEDELKEAKALEREATRAYKGATTGLGLRTVTNVKLKDDPEDGMNWAFDFDPERFYAIAEEIAAEHVRINKLDGLVGFNIIKEKLAR
jgi:hypothetical protein